MINNKLKEHFFVTNLKKVFLRSLLFFISTAVFADKIQSQTRYSYNQFSTCIQFILDISINLVLYLQPAGFLMKKYSFD